MKLDDRHIMIDLETLGAGPRAVIKQIGWAVFTLENESRPVERCGMVHVDAEDCLRHGLVIEADTVAWWLKQDEAARRAMAEKGVDLKTALSALAGPFNPEVARVWAKPSHFDVSILENAHRALRLSVPWNFRNVRDARTLLELFPSPLGKIHDSEVMDAAKKATSLSLPAVPHTAEFDAVAQALEVRAALLRWAHRTGL